MIDHSNCTHPRTPAGRAKCRAEKRGKVSAHEKNRLDIAHDQIGKSRRSKKDYRLPEGDPRWAEMDVDERIREVAKKPAPGQVVRRKVDPKSLTS